MNVNFTYKIRGAVRRGCQCVESDLSREGIESYIFSKNWQEFLADELSYFKFLPKGKWSEDRAKEYLSNLELTIL